MNPQLTMWLLPLILYLISILLSYPKIKQYLEHHPQDVEPLDPLFAAKATSLIPGYNIVLAIEWVKQKRKLKKNKKSFNDAADVLDSLAEDADITEAERTKNKEAAKTLRNLTKNLD